MLPVLDFAQLRLQSEGCGQEHYLGTLPEREMLAFEAFVCPAEVQLQVP